MNILITNMYTHRNKGDAAILLALIEEAKRVFGADSKIQVQTADPGDKGKFGTETSSTLLWILLSSVRNKSIPARVARLGLGTVTLILYLMIFHLFRRKASFILSRDLRGYVKDIHDSDMVIATGGGYLNTSDSSLHETVLLAVTVINFIAGIYLNKPVFVYSVSVGPLYSGLQRAILKFALNRAKLVETREELSLDFVKKLGVTAPSLLTADAALLLGQFSRPSSIVIPRSNRLNVGLTVRKWFKTEREFEAYIAALSDAVDYLIDHHNAEIYCLPQVIADNFDDDDRLMAKRIKDRSKYPERIHVVEDDLHPFEIIGICSKLDFLIGTRMHSTIFSLVSNVPVIGIACEHKTTGLLKGLGIEEFSINVKDLSAEKLQEKVDLLINHRTEIEDRIGKNMEGQISRGKRAMEAIGEAFTPSA